MYRVTGKPTPKVEKIPRSDFNFRRKHFSAGLATAL